MTDSELTIAISKIQIQLTHRTTELRKALQLVAVLREENSSLQLQVLLKEKAKPGRFTLTDSKGGHESS